jgi:hypothetical protein
MRPRTEKRETTNLQILLVTGLLSHASRDDDAVDDTEASNRAPTNGGGGDRRPGNA